MQCSSECAKFSYQAAVQWGDFKFKRGGYSPAHKRRGFWGEVAGDWACVFPPFYYIYIFFFYKFPPEGGSGPLLEVLQYQANPWRGRSKLLHPLLVLKISLISK